ncbi:hypothetical protein MUTS16_00150 (plasmid) [Escherichia coli]|nr:hypothetical protein MUTS16_00150 [Escherichia coli]
MQQCPLDTGVRFFDNALTLGTIIKYTGKARRLSPDFEQDEHTGAIIKQDLPQIPTIIDLYGTYEYNRNLTLKLSVQNLMNRDYSEALNKLNMMPGLGDETTQPIPRVAEHGYLAGTFVSDDNFR